MWCAPVGYNLDHSYQAPMDLSSSSQEIIETAGERAYLRGICVSRGQFGLEEERRRRESYLLYFGFGLCVPILELVPLWQDMLLAEKKFFQKGI